MTESVPKKTNIAEISPHLICALCGGYLIDATTIVECLHSFCKTCIVRYLESSKYCPICEVLVHKTRPLQNIRLDHTLQDIVYKLVPGLFQSEMKRRREFYKDHPTVKSAKTRQEQQRHRIIYSADEQFSISLEFCPNGKIRRPSGRRSRRDSKQQVPERRYLRVPAATTVALLKKFMKLKFNLPPKYKVDIFHGKGPLRDHYSMMDVAYIYSWRREGVLQLYYSVYREPDPVPEITITEVKTENTWELDADAAHRADDMRPSTLFNKAALLGKNTVVKDIHDLSPLELIATVANDISIQESRGQKRKTEDAQLYENEDESSSTETRQIQKSIERAIDLCSSNQGSPGSASGSFPVFATTCVGERRTSCQATVVNSNNSSQQIHSSIQNAPLLKPKLGSPDKTVILQGRQIKNPTKEKPKKTDTASQCDPRPKKLKGEGHTVSHSKPAVKPQNLNKDTKVLSNGSVSEKKPNLTKSDVKSTDKVPSKSNGVSSDSKNDSLSNIVRTVKESEKMPTKSSESTNSLDLKKEVNSSQSVNSNKSLQKPKQTDETMVDVKSDKVSVKPASSSATSVTSSGNKHISVPAKQQLTPSKSANTQNAKKTSGNLAKSPVPPSSKTSISSEQTVLQTQVTKTPNTTAVTPGTTSPSKPSVTSGKISQTPDNVSSIKPSESPKTGVQVNGHLSDSENLPDNNKTSSTAKMEAE